MLLCVRPLGTHPRRRTDLFQEELGHPKFSQPCQMLSSLSWIIGSGTRSTRVHVDPECATSVLTSLRLYVAGSLPLSVSHYHRLSFPRSMPPPQRRCWTWNQLKPITLFCERSFRVTTGHVQSKQFPSLSWMRGSPLGFHCFLVPSLITYF